MDALEAGERLFDACLRRDTAQIETHLDAGAPLWYQEPDSEWTCLHIAAEYNDLDMIKKFLDAGAIWNAGSYSSPTSAGGRWTKSCL